MAGLALFGLGRIGRTHLQGILSNYRCHLRYVVDSQTELAQRVLEEHGVTDVAVLGDSHYHTVLRDPAVEGVVIATPTDTHETYIHDALEASKAVFSEKPLAADVPAIARCYDVARKVDRPLFCGFQRRFDPYFSSIYKRVQAGELGKIYHIQTSSRDGELAPPEYFEGGPGIFHDSVVHDIDITCWLAGGEPEGVFAHGAVHHPGIAQAGDLDTVSVILKFPNKVQGIIHVCRHSTFGYDQRLEVHGERGNLACENPQSSVFLSGVNGRTTSYLHPSFPTRYEAAYKLELNHFIDSILDPSKPLLINRDDVLLSSRVANACERSYKEGKMVALEPAPPPEEVD